MKSKILNNKELQKPTKYVFVILGNLGSGKTTLCQAMIFQNPNLKYLALDDFRMKNFSAHLSQTAIEKKAKKDLKNVLFSADEIIYEMTYSKYHLSNLKRWREKGYTIFLIKLKCSLFECQKRIKNRPAKIKIPFSKSASESLMVLDCKIRNFKTTLVLDSENQDVKTLCKAIFEKWHFLKSSKR